MRKSRESAARERLAAPRAKVISVDAYAEVLGRHFARSVIENINTSDGSSVERIKRDVDHYLQVIRREFLAELERHRAGPLARG